MVSPVPRIPVSLRLLLALATVAAVCAALPVAATAASTRYASPTGTGPSPCLQSVPCSLEVALSEAEGLADGDTVLLAPGTYHPAAPVGVFRAITIAGEPGQPPPLIEATGNFGLFLEQGTFAHDLRIHSPSGTEVGLAAELDVVVERIESTGEAKIGCSLGEVTVRDSLCESAAAVGGSTGISSFTAGTLPRTQVTSLLNVTAVGVDYGIVAGAFENATVRVNATNTIASGGSADVAAASLTATAPVEVNLSHSNFDQVETEGTEVSISEPTENGNQAAPPVFVDEAGGDYREAEGSPTRLAGDLGAVLPGELDLAGGSRTTNCAGTVGVDIGAYQYECPPPPGPPPAQESAPPGNGVPCACVGEGAPRPKLSKLALKPAKFVVEGKAPKGVSHGTTISFTLSAAATVRFEVLGKPTVKGKKRKTVVLGTISEAGKAGANTFKFNGKLKGKPLEPGAFTLRATATAHGLRSDEATEHFTVLAPAG